MFYVPDLAALRDPASALHGVDLYIGDGATVTRSMVRRRGRDMIGHATVGAQLAWCREQGVRRAIFTHCGSEVVRSDARAIGAAIATLGQEQGVEASVAYDSQMTCIFLTWLNAQCEGLATLPYARHRRRRLGLRPAGQGGSRLNKHVSGAGRERRIVGPSGASA